MPRNRKDGMVDKSFPGMNNLLIDFCPKRYDRAVYMNAKIDVTDFCNFIDDLKKENEGLTYFHGMSFIIGKAIYSKPKLNRFISNRTCYVHKNVSIAFTAKTEFKDEAIEYLTVQEIKPHDTLLTMSKVLKEKINKIREHKNEGGANDAIDMFGHAPKFIRTLITSWFKWFDRHGWLPKSLTDDNLYYSSCIVSNIGTFKVGAIYHHLTDIGTASALITFGEIRAEGKRKFMEVGFTIDEGIADGFYLCKSVKLIEYLFHHPEFLLDEACNKVSIPKEEL